ncbi:cellulose binding domain-containing protein, partial [Microvirga sp. P5_D2]
TEIIGATFVTGVTNRIGTPSHDKIALILGSGDAIVINDFGGLRDSTREAFVFADGKKLSMKDVLALVEEKPVTTDLPTAWSSVPGAGRGISVRANSSLDLYGSNDGETLIGRGGDDRLYGNEGFNQLNGNDGRDELYGGNVSDVIVGGNDDDLGYGQSGDDTIVGGAGSDKLYGGGGRDIIYGDTDGSGDGSNISNQGFDFKFGLELESKYRDLFQSAEPVDGIKVTPSALVITPGKNWWGGFEVTLTVKADASLAGWSLFLNSAYEITSIWGAELSKVQDASTSDVYELKNAPWNGSLAKGQTTTIGFTVRTPFDLVVDDHELLLTGLKIGQTAALDMGVAGAVSVMNAKLSAMNEVTVAESYTLTGSNQKAVAISGNKAIDLVGNKLSNVIIGNDGANEITGGGGKDTLTGKGGKDTFIFDTKASKSNVDKVTDFNVNDDYFQLDNAVFKKLGKGTELKPGKLNKDFFTIGTKAKDQNDYIIYNKAKGVLLYDADGSGSGKAVEFATLSKNLKMTSSDLLVI